MGTPDTKIVDDTSKPAGSEVSPKQEVDFEKRYKDTQAAFTKSQQELKATQARATALEQLVTPKVEISEEVKTELENLKFSDPEAWRNKLNTLEREAQDAHKQTLSEAERLVNQATELENRTHTLNEFQKSHPNLVITDDVIKYDVPPRITNKLESGEISFEQYLNDVANYLAAPKVVGDGNKTLDQPNLNTVGGDDTPTGDAIKKDIVQDYSKIVF